MATVRRPEPPNEPIRVQVISYTVRGDVPGEVHCDVWWMCVDDPLRIFWTPDLEFMPDTRVIYEWSKGDPAPHEPFVPAEYWPRVTDGL